MLHLYTNYGPNTSRIFMALHEMDLPHEVHWVDCTLGQHKTAEFLRISPNAKVPALVDDAPADDGPPLALFESGAILLYLAELSGRFLPQATRGRMDMLKWLFWNQANLSPMFGQAYHFHYYAPADQRGGYAERRYLLEVKRLLGVLDGQLAGRDYILGEFSLADFACYPWVAIHVTHVDTDIDLSIADYPQVERWRRRVADRPGVAAGYAWCAANYPGHHGSPEEYRRHMYGDHCAPDLAPVRLTADGELKQAGR